MKIFLTSYSLKHTVTISRMTDGEYKEVMTLGPFDPCSDDLVEFGDRRKKQQERMEKHGNMSLSAVCPFKKVSE